jgi:membrane associated rhomboid family serine protease
MLSDRPYMRGDYPREKTSALIWLLSAIIGGFLLQVVFGSAWLSGSGGRIEQAFALSIGALQEGRLWTLVTHSVLHSPGFIFHVIGNALALYFLGRELIPLLGTRRFVGLYVAATVAGGLAWTAVHWRMGAGHHLGATAAIAALFVVFACFHPNQPLTFLLFFVVPVTIKPKHFVYAFAGFAVTVLCVYELTGAPLPFDMSISSSAHLAGMLTGYVYHRFVHGARWFNPEDRAALEAPRWIRRARKPVIAASEVSAVSPPAPPPPSRADVRAEVDRILDKINSQGFASLTPEEKRLLDDARDLLSRP